MTSIACRHGMKCFAYNCDETNKTLSWCVERCNKKYQEEINEKKNVPVSNPSIKVSAPVGNRKHYAHYTDKTWTRHLSRQSQFMVNSIRIKEIEGRNNSGIEAFWKGR